MLCSFMRRTQNIRLSRDKFQFEALFKGLLSSSVTIYIACIALIENGSDIKKRLITVHQTSATEMW